MVTGDLTAYGTESIHVDCLIFVRIGYPTQTWFLVEYRLKGLF